MTEPADLLLDVKLACALLEPAHQKHMLIPPGIGFFGELGFNRFFLCYRRHNKEERIYKNEENTNAAPWRTWRLCAKLFLAEEESPAKSFISFLMRRN